MFDRLLPYYQVELEALKRLAGEFAAAHPKAAGHLRLSPDTIDDPQVLRLLEGMAFLTGRVQHRLHDEFPELTDALLEMLQPHFLAPVPSCLIARLSCMPDLTGPARLPRGLMVDTDPIAGAPCRFMTTAPVTLWPIEVDQTRLSGLPLPAPANPRAGRAVSVLRLGLSCLAPDMSLGKLGLDSQHVQLRGDGASALFELLAGHLVSVALAQGPNDPSPTLLDAAALEPAGFTAEEALLPWPARSFSGFRLLTEHFALPDKFLGFTLRGLDARTLVEAQRRLDLFFYFDRAAPDLERTVGTDSLALDCVPLVNLFPQRCEPIGALHTKMAHRVVPDVRGPKTLEVWSVERVRETRSDGTWRPWRPLHRLTHGDRDSGLPGGFCRGLDVTLEFDSQAWGSGGLYGLAAVLARFLALHTTINSFVRTRAVLRGRADAVGQ